MFPEYDLLTKREKEVLELACDGYSAKEISIEISISVKTVRELRESIIDKFKVQTFAQVCYRAGQANLLSGLRLAHPHIKVVPQKEPSNDQTA